MSHSDQISPKTFLITEAGHFEARKWPQNGAITIHRSPSAEANGTTITFDAAEAKQLAHAILALLLGDFDRAVTEAYLHTEANQRKLWSGATPSKSTASSAIRPALDLL